MSRRLVVHVATISESVDSSSLEELQPSEEEEDTEAASDWRSRENGLQDDSAFNDRGVGDEDSSPVNERPDLSRSGSIVEYDAPTPPINPLILASLGIESSRAAADRDFLQPKPSSGTGDGFHPRNNSPNPGAASCGISPVVTRRAMVVKPVTRPASELPRPSKLPLVAKTSNSSPTSPSSPSSPSLRSAGAASFRTLTYRHSYSTPPSPSKIPVRTPSFEGGGVGPFVFPSTAGGAAARRMGKVRSQTLQFKEKFVTELTVYDPSLSSTTTETDSTRRMSNASSSGDPSLASSSAEPSPTSPEKAEWVTNPPDTVPELSNSVSGGSRTEDAASAGSRPGVGRTPGSEGEVRRRQIALGVFLATDRCYGGHTIYKMSPMSTLAPMKLRIGDRITAVNGMCVENWSHTCLVEFVRSLTLNCIVTKGPRDIVTCDTQFALTLRRANRQARTADTTSLEDRVDVTLRMDSGAAVVLSVLAGGWRAVACQPTRGPGLRAEGVREREVRAYYTGQSAFKLQVSGDSNRVVRMFNATESQPARVGIGYAEAAQGEHSGCLLMHSYTLPPSVGAGVGRVVTLESLSRGWYLTATSGGPLPAVGVTVSTSAPAAVTSVDARFFRLPSTQTGKTNIGHIQTGKFVSHGSGELLLVDPTPEDRARGFLDFEMFPCTQ